MSRPKPESSQTGRRQRYRPLGLLLWLGLATSGQGQSLGLPALPAPLPESNGPAELPAIPPAPGSPAGVFGQPETPRSIPTIDLAAPRPAQGPGSTAAFVDGLRGNDAAFEVILGQSRILSLKQDLAAGPGETTIASGDPTIVEFLAVSPRQIRITGLRFGTTDLSIIDGRGETHSFEVRVVADLSVLEAKLRGLFPDTSLRLGQIRNNVVVEGQARNNQQIAQILQTVEAYLNSGANQVTGAREVPVGDPERAAGGAPDAMAGPVDGDVPPEPDPLAAGRDPRGRLSGELAGPLSVQGELIRPQVINLLRVPTSQQVMLKVRVAELNRTALRRIGANFLGVDPSSGAIVGTQITGVNNAAAAVGDLAQSTVIPGRNLRGAAFLPSTALGSRNGTTVFGIFQDGNFAFTLNALRRNGMLKILAEPNLVAMSGYPASFLAGGEFPVPVPQVSAGGVAPTVTVQFKEFGVRLGFLPFVVDEDVIRLSVVPEVSEVDFTVAVTLVAGGSPVPGLNVRRAQTTVELREGQTLAIAGLLQVNLDGFTDRVPGLGDLPIIGPMFSNTSTQRVEKEMVVLVTPYIVEAMSPGQVPPLPGDEVKEPNDLELFLLNRIESRTGKDFRSTTRWDDVFDLRAHLKLEQKYVQGPVGFSD